MIRQSPNLYGPQGLAEGGNILCDKVGSHQILAKGKNILSDKVYKELRSISEISFAFSRSGEKLGSFHSRGDI